MKKAVIYELMDAQKEWLLDIGMPRNLLRLKNLFQPSSVGIIMHLGKLEISRKQEPAIVLVRQRDQVEDVLGMHPWGIPAGHKNCGESIADAAYRESKEETGIDIDTSRLRWFCPVEKRGIVFSYTLQPDELVLSGRRRKHELGIQTFRPPRNVDRKEIDWLALVPVEVWMDHMLMGPHRGYRQIQKLHQQKYQYFPASEFVDEEKDFIAAMYKPNIWRAIRHQMFVRRIIPSYLG